MRNFRIHAADAAEIGCSAPNGPNDKIDGIAFVFVVCRSVYSVETTLFVDYTKLGMSGIRNSELNHMTPFTRIFWAKLSNSKG